MSAGAYGMTMACNYNGRPLPAEILVSGDQADYLRLRENIHTTWKYEGIPQWLLFEEEEQPEEKKEKKAPKKSSRKTPKKQAKSAKK